MITLHSQRRTQYMRSSWLATMRCLAIVLLTGCTGGKQEITLPAGATYRIQSSGKMSVSPPTGAEGAQGAEPLHKLRVKKKNEEAGKTAGCWLCSDCICNSDDCSCTECSAC
jgi:hypothetical protein